MNNTFAHPIIGQEAVCPDGLGRVSEFKDDFPTRYIVVDTYINNRSCKWDPENVQLVPIVATPAEPSAVPPDAWVVCGDAGFTPDTEPPNWQRVTASENTAHYWRECGLRVRPVYIGMTI